MAWPRVAIDTAVVITGLANPGSLAGRSIERWYAGHFDLVCTGETLDEYRRKLLHPDSDTPQGDPIGVEEFLALVELVAVRARPSSIEAIPRMRDDTDRIWLQAAVGGEADFLVTYDNDFLQDLDLIHEMRVLGTRIVTPRILHHELDAL
jgi:putative PIN family toxin of toxin-antitoxin system